MGGAAHHRQPGEPQTHDYEGRDEGIDIEGEMPESSDFDILSILPH